MRCEANVGGLMVKRLECVVVVVASEASAQGVMTVRG